SRSFAGWPLHGELTLLSGFGLGEPNLRVLFLLVPAGPGAPEDARRCGDDRARGHPGGKPQEPGRREEPARGQDQREARGRHQEEADDIERDPGVPCRQAHRRSRRRSTNDATGIRSWTIESRSRTVAARSSSVLKSTVTQKGVPTSSWRRYRRPIDPASS